MPANTDPAYWKDKYVFPQMIDGYMKGLGERFNDETRRRLKEIGLDCAKLPPAIPGQDMQRYLPVIAEVAFPSESPAERMRQLGLWSIRGWQKGLLGAAATQMLRLIGPRRALQRLDRAFSTADNFSKSTTEFLTDKEALVTITDPNDVPSYWQGILEAGVEMLGLVGTVTVEPSRKPYEVLLRVKWN